MSGVVVYVLEVCIMLRSILAATHTVSTIQTFVAGAATHGDVAAGIAGWCIALHTF